ncbi:M20/M25/M40 family metallo-hydrolase [Paraflavitalea pollutisoli]|uniref:M20/M25/M40 family metallo-hydrolase n=1 Tax=Paraflavitalea pollutisoli TaxID=3034143 RepID=UPI0023EE0157|nr:M20/M25/M40 family metallo-hydrolase [Paraflavitalea sp. H1-2-19X]
MWRLIGGILLLALIVAIIVVVKTFTYPFTPVAKTAPASADATTLRIEDISLQRFAGGIQIPTVSNADYTHFNYQPFDSFMVYLRQVYPLLYEKLEYYTINQRGMVFHWKGSNAALKPVLFLSHYDVVPPGNSGDVDSVPGPFKPGDQALPPINAIAQAWDHFPFSGAVEHGRVYGRGTLDMKNMLFALLEACEKLVKEGFKPSRDIYFAFGFDEEVGGTQGAQLIADDFKQKGIRFDAVYDEGGIVSTKGSLTGIDATVALIGCAEKGFWSARVKVKGLGGHSSMPPLETAIGKAAVIMQRLEKDQMKPMVIPVIDQFFTNVGGTMSFTSRMAIANQWLLKGVLMRSLTKSHTTNALVRTTTALTMLKGSDASNVLAPEVEFVVNFRLLPGNKVADVRKHLENACKGYEVTIEDYSPPREASGISSIASQGYTVMKRTIGKLFPDALVTPYLTIGGTDAYKYEQVSDHVYRFSPVAINNFEQQTIHNNNEYISVTNFARMIRYYELMFREYDQP